MFGDKKLAYFFHLYKVTWRHVRAIIILFIWDIMIIANGKKNLEADSILSNYFLSAYDVVDKYDISYGVLRKNVIDI